MTNSRLKYFVGACILAGGLLVKLGAPLPAVAAGMILALAVTSRFGRHFTSTR